VSVSFDLDPAEFRRLGERLIELMAEAVGAEHQDPVLRDIDGPSLLALLDSPLPEEPTPVDRILDDWRDKVMPYTRRNGHPRFFGYVCTSADPVGVFADGMASALNTLVTAWRSTPGAATVERIAVRWLHELTSFGGDGGLLTSGGSAANLHGLACAVVRAEQRAGLPDGSRHRLTLYMSVEAHVSMPKAARLLGIPRTQVRLIDVDEHRRMRIDQLAATIDADLAEGLVPPAV
jgi:glutamate/tyrosine decarboxylase-like PLP-dependent enzyme